MPASPAPDAPLESTPPRRWSWVTPRLLRTLLIVLIVLLIANVIAYVWVNSSSPSVPPTSSRR